MALSVAQLRHDFDQHTVVCALQCAGNRRHIMRTKMKEVSGVDWGEGAVMNCQWRGPLLCDVLERVGVQLDGVYGNGHVAFACYEMEAEDASWYGASIPLSRAMRRDAEVVLALEMNGEVLSVRHGYPVRVVVPGVAGARAVKWLNEIAVQREESENHYQHYDYKVLPEDVETMEQAKKEVWDSVAAVQDMPVNSVIALPESQSTVQCDADGAVVVAGYALPGGEDGPIVRVEVSTDCGQSWQDAKLLTHLDESKWSWKLWEARVQLQPGSGHNIYSRATDKGGNTQPKQSTWNVRGVCYNGWGLAEDIQVEE